MTLLGPIRPLLAITALGISSAAAQVADPKPSQTQSSQERVVRSAPRTKRGATRPPTESSPPSAPRGLPFQLEVGLGTNPQQVIMAVDAVTFFHCPQPVLQLVFGDKEGLNVAESIESKDEPHNKNDFYIRPAKPGILTNLLIEMKDTTVVLQLRTVYIKGGPRLGDYNGEIFVRLPGYQDELIKSRTIISTIEHDLAECSGHIEELKRATARAQADALASVEQGAIQEALRIISSGGKPGKKGETKGARITQIGRSMRFQSGRWWAILEIENKSKHDQLAIKYITAPGYGKILFASRPVEPRQRVRFAIVIEPAEHAIVEHQSGAALIPMLNIVLDDGTLTLALDE